MLKTLDDVYREFMTHDACDYLVDFDTLLPEQTFPSLDLTSFELSVAEAVETEPTKVLPEKNEKNLKRVGGLIFYGLLAAIFIFVLLSRFSGNRPYIGFSVFEVLTGSMQSTLPQGSWILVKHTGPAAIKEGDDITFLKDHTTKVTHRVISVIENYDGEGRLGFETKGLENPLPDEQIVDERNVLGKVVWHAEGMRDSVEYIKSHWYIAAISVVLLTGVITLLVFIFSKRKERKYIL